MSDKARRAFYGAMMRHGFTLLRLHKVDADGVCQCREGKSCRNAGRHFATRYGWQSVIPTLDDLEKHLDEGGSVGLSLWYEDDRIPQSPGRLVVFDCDEADAEPWLRAKGITSPLMVQGKRGVHVYCRMPADVPLLKSDTRTLKSPKVDIKVSGLVLAPWSPEKRLCIHGRDVSDDPAAIEAFLGDYDALMMALPEVDPRVIVPNMTERYPQSEEFGLPQEKDVVGAKAASQSRLLKKRVRFSAAKPKAYYPDYVGLPYNRRKNNAITHAKKVKPSIQGKEPWAKLLKVVADCILHYGMSDKDTWEVVREHYNPRCKHRDGTPYPWRKEEVAWAIQAAHQPGSYSTLDAVRGEVDIAKAVEQERARGQRANARRLERQRRAKEGDYESIRAFLRTFYEDDDGAVVLFCDLLRGVNRALVSDGQGGVTPQRLGRLLKEEGLVSEKGVVRGLRIRLCDDPDRSVCTGLCALCPASPCPSIT